MTMLIYYILNVLIFLPNNPTTLGNSNVSVLVDAFATNAGYGQLHLQKGSFSRANPNKEVNHGWSILFYKNKDEEDEVEVISKDVLDHDAEEERKSILRDGSQAKHSLIKKFLESLPPIQIEDTSLLFYDVFLILNLSVSISFWVVHRMSFSNIVPAFSEGSLLSILWVVSGLINGSFLYSAVDGHYDVTKEEYEDKGGPNAAGMLGLFTFIGAANIRLFVALIMALIEHRKFGTADGEELIPLELACGLFLMSVWRMLHSSYTRV